MNAVLKIPREFLFLAEETSGNFGSWGHITSKRVDHFRKLTKLVINMFSVHPHLDFADDVVDFLVGLALVFRNLLGIG